MSLFDIKNSFFTENIYIIDAQAIRVNQLLKFHELIVIIATQTAFLVDDKVSSLVDDKRKAYDALISANEKRVLNGPRYIIEVN